MPKRRTRKNKEKAKHSFNVKWNAGSLSMQFEPNVKGHLKTDSEDTTPTSAPVNSSDISVQDSNLATIKRDIAKSLILAGLMLASELVLYLVWR